MFLLRGPALTETRILTHSTIVRSRHSIQGTFAILAVLFLDGTAQIIATFFDFVLFVGYLTSARLPRHNFHRHSRENPLRDSLINIRTSHGINGREDRNGGLVRLVVGLVVI
ncbi:hypothetical protein B9Z19DRAFT_1084812 [Tuber borchii]|uniref:Uncharacterized protein n=1 Tax=Tuber borchii TaxID=42251 RepID=A0A2T6ZRJ8_TUBBO|nr:hypothetical protein B9Z19DRAFT_1084812 [Tuber borchii]